MKINWRKIVCCLKNVNVAYLQNVWEENTCYKMVKLGGETKLTCASRRAATREGFIEHIEGGFIDETGESTLSTATETQNIVLPKKNSHQGNIH